MGFETPQQPDIPSPEISPYEKEKKTLAEKIKKYVRLAALYALLAAPGVEMINITLHDDADYKNHIENISPDKKESYKIIRAELVSIFGEDYLEKIEARDEVDFLDRREQKENPTEPKITGFEKIGLDNKILKEAWGESGQTINYPKGWINGEIEEITYKDKERKMDEGYGNNLSNEKAAANYGGRSITFFETHRENMEGFTKSDLLDFLDETFSHESGHANDWEENKHLEINERFKLLSDVVKRLESDHPFRAWFNYLDTEKTYSQKIENKDKQQEMMLKAKEYWADIVSGYFQEPTIMQKDYPDDFKIVDAFVKQRDPSFDPFRSLVYRRLTLYSHPNVKADMSKLLLIN